MSSGPEYSKFPMGIPVHEAIMGLARGPAGGRAVKAFSPSGAASGFIPYDKFKDTHLDFKSMRPAGTMLGSGAIVVRRRNPLRSRYDPERNHLLSQ